MSQTFADVDQTGSATTCIGQLEDRTDTLRSSFSGSSAPSSPVDGQLWLDTSGSEDILKVYADLEGSGGAWYEVGSVLHGDLKLRNNELVDARLENLGSHTSPASGVVGEVYLYTGDNKARVIVSSTVREVVLSGSSVDFIPVRVFGDLILDATNPPTAGTKGTTPTVRGWLFDAANELASFSVRVPAGYSATADCKLRLTCVLNQAETSGDDIDWTADLVSIAPSSSEVVSGTSTQATVAQDMGANVSEGAVHVVDITLDFDDATNPIAPGDLLCVEIHRTNLSNCGGVLVTDAAVLFPLGTKVTE